MFKHQHTKINLHNKKISKQVTTCVKHILNINNIKKIKLKQQYVLFLILTNLRNNKT